MCYSQLTFLNPFAPAPPDPLRSFRCWEAGRGLWSYDMTGCHCDYMIKKLPITRTIRSFLMAVIDCVSCVCKLVRKYAAARHQGPPARRPHICVPPAPMHSFYSVKRGFILGYVDCCLQFVSLINKLHWSVHPSIFL